MANQPTPSLLCSQNQIASWREKWGSQETVPPSLDGCQGDWTGSLLFSHHPFRRTGLLPLQN